MVYLPKIAKDITKSEDLSIVSQTIDQFIQLINKMIKSDKKNQRSLDNSQVDYSDDIKEIRRQVDDYFNDLEKGMNIFHNENTDLLQQHIKSLNNSRDKLKKLQTAIQPLSAHNDSQLFIEMFKANEKFPEFLHNLTELAQTPQTISFHLNLNQKFKQLLATTPNLGELSVFTAVTNRKLPNLRPLPILQLPQPSSSAEETGVTSTSTRKQQSNESKTISESSPVVAATPTISVSTYKAKQHHNQQRQVQQEQQQEQHYKQQQQQQLYSASNGHDINVKMASDEMFCDVNGICQIPNGDILLTDAINNKVKRLNTDYEPTQYLDLPASPTAICCMGDTEAAATDVNKTIHFLSITKSTMAVTKTMTLDHECSGIAYHHGRLFVTDKNKNVCIYTTSEKRLKVIQTDNAGLDIFSLPRYVCVSPDGSKIYVTDFSKGLVILDSEGNYLSKYKSSDLRGPRAVCVDNQGRVLVCGWLSGNVFQLEEGGMLVGQVCCVGDDILNPQSICIDNHKSTLILGVWKNDCIRVFDMKRVH